MSLAMRPLGLVLMPAVFFDSVLEDLRLGVGVGGGSPRTQQDQWQGVERALYKMTKLWEAWGVYPPTFLRVCRTKGLCSSLAVIAVAFR